MSNIDLVYVFPNPQAANDAYDRVRGADVGLDIVGGWREFGDVTLLFLSFEKSKNPHKAQLDARRAIGFGISALEPELAPING